MPQIPGRLRLALAGAAGGLVVALLIDLLGGSGGALPYTMYPVAGLIGGLLGGWARRQKDRHRNNQDGDQ